LTSHGLTLVIFMKVALLLGLSAAPHRHQVGSSSSPHVPH
jgi:hypothetical protein